MIEDVGANDAIGAIGAQNSAPVSCDQPSILNVTIKQLILSKSEKDNDYEAA